MSSGSRINSFQRNWSSSQDSAPAPSSQKWAPQPPSSSQQLSDAERRARRIAAIEAAVNKRDEQIELDKQDKQVVSGKRDSPIDIDALYSGSQASTSAAPPAKRARTLPWEQKDAPRPADRNYMASTSEKPVAFNSSGSQNAKPVISLSDEQKHILNLVLEGKNIFFTGSAGTGKSVLLREIITKLREKYGSATDAVAVTASTGIAACNIGGVTLHSFSGAGLAIEAVSVLAAKVRRNKKAAPRWMRTKVLVIDEISMVDGDLFDKMAGLAQLLRGSQRPFGGIQVIVTGDFFQLPPVTKTGQPKFAFDAEQWGNVIDHTFNLTQVFRQKDPTFVEMLNEMRFGRLSDDSIRRFNALSRELPDDEGFVATELFPRREDVDRSNENQLKQLDNQKLQSYTYVATDSGTAEPETREKLLANFMAVKKLRLTLGSQVMLIRNSPDDPTLVNGSTGIVSAFMDPPGGRTTGSVPWPVVRFKMPGAATGQPGRDVMVNPETFKVELPNGEVQAQRTQVPLILSWAMSIHKSQGQTLDRVKVDLRKVFEKGQAYVALSRATSLQGLQVLGFDRTKVQAHPKVVQWSKTLKSVSLD